MADLHKHNVVVTYRKEFRPSYKTQMTDPKEIAWHVWAYILDEYPFPIGQDLSAVEKITVEGKSFTLEELKGWHPPEPPKPDVVRLRYHDCPAHGVRLEASTNDGPWQFVPSTYGVRFDDYHECPSPDVGRTHSGDRDGAKWEEL